MPSYVVRWPMLSAALVRADDEDDLLDQLDEQANPQNCRYEVYDGPLFVDFNLNAKLNIKRRSKTNVVLDEDIKLDSMEIFEEGPMEVIAGECETGEEMCEEVLRFAFPNTHEAYWDEMRDEPDATDPLQRAELEQAVVKDSMELVKAAWNTRAIENATDEESKLARELDMPKRLVEYHKRMAEADEQEGQDDEQQEDEQMATDEETADKRDIREFRLRYPVGENDGKEVVLEWVQSDEFGEKPCWMLTYEDGSEGFGKSISTEDARLILESLQSHKPSLEFDVLKSCD